MNDEIWGVVIFSIVLILAVIVLYFTIYFSLRSAGKVTRTNTELNQCQWCGGIQTAEAESNELKCCYCGKMITNPHTGKT
jgi:hypothetical protein